MDLFFTNTQILASQDVNWWTEVVWITLWCFYQLFGLSFWRHPRSHCLTNNQHNIMNVCFREYWCSAVVCVDQPHSSSDDRDDVWREQMKLVLVSVISISKGQMILQHSWALISPAVCVTGGDVYGKVRLHNTDVAHCVIIIFTQILTLRGFNIGKAAMCRIEYN